MSRLKSRSGVFAGLLALVLLIPIMFVVVIGGGAAIMGGAYNALAKNCEIETVQLIPSAGGESISSKGPLLRAFQKQLEGNPDYEEAEQDKIISAIVSIGRQKGLSPRAQAVAVATAAQETNILNILDERDEDSGGVFQQRPGVVDQVTGIPYWGTYEQVRQVPYAVNRFYDEMLKKVSKDGIETLPMIQVAIMIQNPRPSAYYSRWAWDDLATEVVQSVGQAPSDGSIKTASTQTVARPSSQCSQLPQTDLSVAIAAMRWQIGKPYIWNEGEIGGYDGSGLVSWAYGKANVSLPVGALGQYEAGKKVDKAELKPGDVVFFATDSADAKSINRAAFWVGNNQIARSDGYGKPIEIQSMAWEQFVGAIRPVPEPSSVAVPVGSPGTTVVAGDDYPYKDKLTWDMTPLGANDPRVHSELGYLYRECVDFVSWRLNQQAGVTKPPFKFGGMGHAATWKAGLLSRGFVVSDRPVAGSVLWLGPYQGDPSVMFANNKWGHVAWVAAVNADGTMEVEQYNVGSPEFRFGDHKYHKVTLPASFASKATFLIRGNSA